MYVQALADLLAKEGRITVELAWGEQRNIQIADALAWKVRRRIIAANLPAAEAKPTLQLRQHRPLREGAKQDLFHKLVQASGRIPFRNQKNHRLRCRCCQQSTAWSRRYDWLRAGNCPGLNISMWGGWFGGLGDEPHTVYRAELRGLIGAVEHTEGDMEVLIDNWAVAQGYLKGKWRNPMGRCADLWRRLQVALAEHEGEVSVRWIKGHAEEDYFEIYISFWVYPVYL